MKTFKQMLNDGEPINVFAIGRVMHPVLIDMFGLAGGYHGFWIDQEHAGVTIEDMKVAAIAARANGFDCFVRVPPVGYWLVTQSLETGVGGIMAAQIHSAAHAEEFVRWTKFFPRGTRGLNAAGRDANYTHLPAAQFVEEANRDRLVAIQIETLGALEEADAIAGMDDVDMLFVGPADLSLALGVVGQYHHEKLWEAIGRVDAACAKHGKYWGAVTPDAQFADRAAGMQCRMFSPNNEITMMRRGIERIKETFAEQFGG